MIFIAPASKILAWRPFLLRHRNYFRFHQQGISPEMRKLSRINTTHFKPSSMARYRLRHDAIIRAGQIAWMRDAIFALIIIQAGLHAASPFSPTQYFFQKCWPEPRQYFHDIMRLAALSLDVSSARFLALADDDAAAAMPRQHGPRDKRASRAF